MNGDPRLKHIPLFPLESEYERIQHQIDFEAEQQYRNSESQKSRSIIEQDKDAN